MHCSVGFCSSVRGSLQALVLIQAEGFVSLWRDIRGRLLLVALCACATVLRRACVVARSGGLAGVQLSCAWVSPDLVLVSTSRAPDGSGRARKARP